MPLIESLPDADLVPDPEAEHHRRTGWRWLGALVLSTTLGGYLLAATLLALVATTASGPEIDAVALLAAAVPGWLAVHQVPLELLGAPLSVLPFLPTILFGVLTAAATAAAQRRIGLVGLRDSCLLVGVLAGAHGVLGALLAGLLGGFVDASVPGAFLRCGLLVAAAASVGACRSEELVEQLRARITPEVAAGLRGALLSWTGVLAAGALVAVLALCLGAPRVAELVGRAGSAGDAFGMVLLSLLYLPNAALAGWSFAAGPGIDLGALAVRLFGIEPAPVPELPLLAALPPGPAGWWWPVAMVLPVAVGVLLGARCGRELAGRRRMTAVALAALAAGFGVLVVAALTGGALGGGRFDPVTLHPLLLAAATTGWLLVPALPAAWLAPAPPAPVDVPEPRASAEAPAPEEGLAEDADDTGENGDTDSGDTEEDFEEDGTSGDDLHADAEPEDAEPEESGLPGDAGQPEDDVEFDLDEAEWADLVLRAQQAEAQEPPVSWSGEIHADEEPTGPADEDGSSGGAAR
ncbi:DUF6350 family protein [Saccharopolyspora sp. MS10]|uniref:cell division protein PerM n=1 Tax=Saccharopolyspora sp. MS10 TaxID=3385973 RepID=UPI00399FB8C1